MLSTLLFASILAAAHDSEPQSPDLLVRGAEDHVLVAALDDAQRRLLLPLVTRSTEVRHAALHRGRVELLLRAAADRSLVLESWNLSAVAHGADEQILIVEGELTAVGPPRLPVAVRGADGADLLPRLARRDGLGCIRETLSVSPAADGNALFALSLASPDDLPALGLGRRYLVGGNEGLELEVGERGLDQLFHATSRSLTGQDLTPVQVVAADLLAVGDARGRALDMPLQLPLEIPAGQALRLRVAAPEETGAEERSATFIVDLRTADASTAREAAAPRDELPTTPGFRDVSAAAGLSEVHFEGPDLQLDIRPTMGPGSAWGDFDGDGHVDLYLVQGGGREGSRAPTNRLMRNRGDGTFQAVPGAEDAGAGMGALFFDLEGDGDLDLYVANYGPDGLYRNDGQQGFVDVSAEHELAGDGWSAGLCAGDVDGDGDLDLYVTSYLDYDPAKMPPVEELPGMAREDPIEMLPFAFPGARNAFLENVDGKLVDRTEEMGLEDVQGRGMQPIFWDFDLDGDPDLYVANDVSFNLLLRNEGGRFQDISFQTGMDDPRGGMGVCTGDVDGDGDPDLFLTNWELEANALYRNDHVHSTSSKVHRGTFKDVTVPTRLGSHGVGVTSWGCVFFDADNDGDMDLFVPNGYTSPDYESTGLCVGQPNQLFLNDGEGRFEEASALAGPAVTAHHASRAAALCDYDRDGRLDLFVTNNNGPYQLLHNELPSRGHWLGVELRGRGGNTGAVGARVVLRADGLEQSREVQAGSGYLAGHDLGVHFGMGRAERVERLTVHWPSGRTSHHEVSAVDRWTRIEEPPGDK